MENERKSLAKKKIEELQNLVIWMTGCGYNFYQHEYFCNKVNKFTKDKETKEIMKENEKNVVESISSEILPTISGTEGQSLKLTIRLKKDPALDEFQLDSNVFSALHRIKTAPDLIAKIQAHINCLE